MTNSSKSNSATREFQRDLPLTFRPISDQDLELLYRIYAATRTEELEITDWSDAEKEQFLRFQFNAQHQHYQEHYPGAQFDLISLDGEPIGRLYIDRWKDEHRIVDIALLPEYRGHGIGGRIMRDLLTEAAAVGKPVRIHVERNNPAMRLYTRLGFHQIGDTGVYLLLEWHQ